jgi:hypothetical protein
MAKETVNRMKKKPTEWEKIFAMCTSEKRPLYPQYIKNFKTQQSNKYSN